MLQKLDLTELENISGGNYCSNTFAWVGLSHSTFYGFVVGGPAGAGLGAFTALAYTVGGTLACP